MDDAQISSIDTQCRQGNKATPINTVLAEWATKEGATVGTLVRALRHVGRNDVIRLVQSDHKTSPQAV